MNELTDNESEVLNPNFDDLKFGILGTLAKHEVRLVDPDALQIYEQAIAQAGDNPAEIIQAEIAYYDRVAQLRKDGKLSSTQELTERVNQLEPTIESALRIFDQHFTKFREKLNNNQK